MDLDGDLLNRASIFKARIVSGHVITVPVEERDTVGLQKGSEVKVMAIRLGERNADKPRKRDRFDTTVQQHGQINIPKRVYSNLNVGEGDYIQVAVLPKSNFPNLSDGPVRSKARSARNKYMKDEANDFVTAGHTESYKAPLQKSGQINVNKDAMDELGVNKGSMVKFHVKKDGSEHSWVSDIGKRARVTVPKEAREKADISPGDEVEMVMEI